MILPHLERALVPMEKLTTYLLSDTHPDGAPKIDTGTDIPRLVTAYPLKGAGDD